MSADIAKTGIVTTPDSLSAPAAPADLSYTTTLEIQSNLVNLHRRLRTSALFTLLQQASIRHTEELGCRRDRTLDRGILWVISRQYLRIRRMPDYGELVTLVTTPGRMTQLFFPRFYTLSAGGELLAEGETLWLLMDEKSRSAVFPKTADISLPGERRPEHTLSGALRPPEGLLSVSESICRARFSQADINGHINNACYYDILDDLLPAEMTARTPREIWSEYRTEVLPGEDIAIRISHNDSGLWFFDGTDALEAPAAQASGESKTAAMTKPRFRILMQF